MRVGVLPLFLHSPFNWYDAENLVHERALNETSEQKIGKKCCECVV